MLDAAEVMARGRFPKRETDADLSGGMNDSRYPVLRRDQWTCGGCGLRTTPSPADIWGGLELHHVDLDPGNRERSNLRALCPLCHGLVHLDRTLDAPDPGPVLLWAPELPQAFLTLLVHLRAVAELRAREEGLGEAGERFRSRCSRLMDEARALGLGRGIFVEPATGEDLGARLEASPSSLRRALASRLREADKPRRRALASRLRGLRLLFDWREDRAARALAASELWARGPSWAAAWLELAEGLLKRTRERAGSPEGGMWR